MNENNKQTLFGTIITLVILAIIGLILFFSCGGEEEAPLVSKKISSTKEQPEQEKKEQLSEFIEKKEFYPTKEVMAVYTVYRAKPEIRHKKYVGYYKTGERKMEYTYKDNSKEGPLVFLYENKQKALEGAFLNDSRDGEFKEYFPNGNLKLTYVYKDGLLEGTWIEYYDDGKTKMIEKSFKADKLDGTFIHYTRKNTVKDHKYYRNGKIARPVSISKTDKPDIAK